MTQIFNKHAEDGLVVSLDAEKAFKPLEKAYFFFTLKMLGLDNDCITWVRVLYNYLMIAVITNKVTSGNFKVQKGSQ